MTMAILESQNLISIGFMVFGCYTANSLFRKGMRIRKQRTMYQDMMKKYKPDESMFRECPRAKKQEKKEE